MPSVRDLLHEEGRRALPSPEGLERTVGKARRRQRRRQLLTTAVVLVLFAGSLSGVFLAFREHREAVPVGRPSAEPTIPTTGPAGTALFKVLPVRLVSSSPKRLVVESPPGQVRWTLAGCNIHAVSLPSGKPRGGGGGDCEGTAYLGWLSVGTGFDGKYFKEVYGRTVPTAGYRVTITFWNGKEVTVSPHDGLWIVIVRAGICNPGAGVKRVQVAAPDGHVVASDHAPRFGPSCPSPSPLALK